MDAVRELEELLKGGLPSCTTSAVQLLLRSHVMGSGRLSPEFISVQSSLPGKALSLTACLVAFLVSTSARDASLLFTTAGASLNADRDKDTLTSDKWQVRVIDLDPKHPSKLSQFVRKDKELVELWESTGRLIFQSARKSCGAWR